MTERRGVGRRGNIKGQAIYFGRATLSIATTATTGVVSVTYSPTYDSEPYLIVSIPEWSQTTGGSAARVDSTHLSNKAAIGFAIHAWLDAAPGSYKTVTLQYDYIVIGEPND